MMRSVDKSASGRGSNKDRERSCSHAFTPLEMKGPVFVSASGQCGCERNEWEFERR